MGSAASAKTHHGLSGQQWRVWLGAAMSIFLDGYDLFIIAVAFPLIDQQMAIPSFLEGAIAASVVAGAVVGASTVGSLADKLGRARLFNYAMAGFIVITIFTAIAWDPYSLLAGRFIMGIAIGAVYPLSAATLSEFMPETLRRRTLFVSAFSFQALGIFIGAGLGVAILLADPHESAWRFMLLSGLIPAVAVIVLRRGVPETPEFLRSREEAAAEHKTPLKELLAPGTRIRTALATGPWFLMDIALYGIGFVTPVIIGALALGGDDDDFIAEDIAQTESTALLDVFLVLGFVAAIVMVARRVDTMKMQWLGFGGMAIGMLLLAFAATEVGPPHPSGGAGAPTWALVLTIVGFVLFNFSVNAGPNPATYLHGAELFPPYMRGSGHGIAAASGKLGAVIGLFLLPIIQEVSLPGALLAVAGVCFLGMTLTVVLSRMLALQREAAVVTLPVEAGVGGPR